MNARGSEWSRTAVEGESQNEHERFQDIAIAELRAADLPAHFRPNP